MKTPIVIKPIKTKKDYKDALSVLESYFDTKTSNRENELIEILSVLVEKYEEEHFPIEAPNPIEAIKFRKEQLGLSNKDIANVLGGRNRLSEIFNKKRNLTIKMMRALHKKLQIPVESLLGA